MRVQFLKRLAWVVGAAALVSACAESETPTDEPNLANVTVPTDFKFETSRPVDVALDLAPELQAEATSAALTIKRSSDGKIIYRGPMALQGALTLKLALPTKDTSLDVTVTAAGRVLEQNVAIQDGTARHTFR